MLKYAKYICAFTFSILFFCMTTYAIDVSAKHAIVIEAESGDIVFQKNADIKAPMASTTKIMTAIIAIENSDLSKKVKINSAAIGVEGSSIYLKEGEILTMEDLLYALLLESANDSAVAIAYEVGGTQEAFVDMMNEKAIALGLENTHFTNPHGLDNEEHYTSAHDLAIIASYAMKNPIFEEIVSTQKRVIPLNDNEASRVLINHNKLLKTYDGAIGVKTGFTKKSGRCLVSCSEVDGVRMICVTLNAPNDWNDHKVMLDYATSLYEHVNLADIGSYTLSLDTINGEKSKVLCSNYEPFAITLKKDNINITASYEANRMVAAPISQNDILGRIVFYNNGDEIGAVNLYSLEKVKEIKYKKSIIERILDKWKK